jgi:hypothetical protein
MFFAPHFGWDHHEGTKKVPSVSSLVSSAGGTDLAEAQEGTQPNFREARPCRIHPNVMA